MACDHGENRKEIRSKEISRTIHLPTMKCIQYGLELREYCAQCGKELGSPQDVWGETVCP